MVFRLFAKSILSAAVMVAGFAVEIKLVIRLYGMVKDIMTIARLRLTVKPMFRNSVNNAEPMPRRLIGTALSMALRFGATKSPVPAPSKIMYRLKTV